MLCENGRIEEWWGFLDGQLEYKGTIYATHSVLANPPLHKSVYGATDFLKTGEVNSTNVTGIRCIITERGSKSNTASPLATYSAGR